MSELLNYNVTIPSDCDWCKVLKCDAHGRCHETSAMTVPTYDGDPITRPVEFNYDKYENTEESRECKVKFEQYVNDGIREKIVNTIIYRIVQKPEKQSGATQVEIIQGFDESNFDTMVDVFKFDQYNPIVPIIPATGMTRFFTLSADYVLCAQTTTTYNSGRVITKEYTYSKNEENVYNWTPDNTILNFSYYLRYFSYDVLLSNAHWYVNDMLIGVGRVINYNFTPNTTASARMFDVKLIPYVPLTNGRWVPITNYLSGGEIPLKWKMEYMQNHL